MVYYNHGVQEAQVQVRAAVCKIPQAVQDEVWDDVLQETPVCEEEEGAVYAQGKMWVPNAVWCRAHLIQDEMSAHMLQKTAFV